MVLSSELFIFKNRKIKNPKRMCGSSVENILLSLKSFFFFFDIIHAFFRGCILKYHFLSIRFAHDLVFFFFFYDPPTYARHCQYTQKKNSTQTGRSEKRIHTYAHLIFSRTSLLFFSNDGKGKRPG